MNSAITTCRMSFGSIQKRTGGGAAPILTSTYLRLDHADGYLPVIEDMDLRSQVSADVLAAQIPPCPAG